MLHNYKKTLHYKNIKIIYKMFRCFKYSVSCQILALFQILCNENLNFLNLFLLKYLFKYRILKMVI